MYLNKKTFETVVQSTPLVSIDFILTDEQNRVLLGRRVNRPAKDYWFVPGGRILKGELIEQAFARLSMAETGVSFELKDALWLGNYDHFYTDSAISESISTHYVVLAYQLSVNLRALSLPYEQHADYSWFGIDEALASKQVHKHTKWYFEALQSILVHA